MRKNNLFKTLIIIVTVVWSGIVLLPTFQLSQQKAEAEKYYFSIESNTSLEKNNIKAALSSGNLELQVRDNFIASEGKTVDDVLPDVSNLISVDEKIKQNEPKSIKLGLDLQGGTYLVYEVNLPQLLINLSKQQDTGFEAAVKKIEDRVRVEDVDFFEVLQDIFQQDSLQLGRYFGKRGDTDSEIIDYLSEEAEDAVERTLEVLRNRIDQFGVSEPSITKQGSQRIVVELAGIKDVARAKDIVGRTALLEFQLEMEPEVANAVIKEINLVMRRQLANKAVSAQGGETGDSAAVETRLRKDTEVSLEDIFGESSILEDKGTAEGEDADSTVLVAQEVLEDRPFSALIRDYGGDIAVPTQNVRTVERILNQPDVLAVMPKNAEFLFFNDPVSSGEQEFYRIYLLKKEPEMTGSMVADAQIQIGSELQAGQAVVSMELTSEGARIFSKVTGANVNKRMAIVLDSKIVSIPNITERIPSGRAQITGMDNMEEAKDLAIVLRAGALPAPIEVIQERTVGPSLGQDSITKGTYSAMVGLIMVVIFMVVYYKLSGLVANFALLLNLVVIMAVLAGFHATLTLPGIAGIILTIGMAVDANVLIFERIREELRNGKTVRASIEGGYGKAFSTIMDANITTLLTALVLYQFGTGAIRGFALTLSIGILISMFTAIVVTRVIFDYFTNQMTIKKLSI